MILFICWSGPRSRLLARSLAEYLEKTVAKLNRKTAIRCFVSDSGISKGELWFDRIRQELAAADAGIICITPENLDSRWMHFEAGALFGKKDKSKIYTYFLGENPDEVKDPFKNLQITVSTKHDTRNLLAALLSSKVEQLNFSASDPEWEKFGKRLEEIRTPRIEQLIPDFERTFQRKTFQEPLNECPDQQWLDRFIGAHETFWKLRSYQSIVERACRPFQIWFFDRLLSELDGYMREMREFLLGERKFTLNEDGTLDFKGASTFPSSAIPPDLDKAVERRCRRIRGLAFLLNWPGAAPVCAEALAFERLRPSEFAERKALLRASRSYQATPDCRRSFWQYDRIVYYLDSSSVAPLMEQLEWVADEIERARATGIGSAMALHYAVRSVRSVVERSGIPPQMKPSLSRYLTETRKYLEERGQSEAPVEENLKQIEERLSGLAVQGRMK